MASRICRPVGTHPTALSRGKLADGQVSACMQYVLGDPGSCTSQHFKPHDGAARPQSRVTRGDQSLCRVALPPHPLWHRRLVPAVLEGQGRCPRGHIHRVGRGNAMMHFPGPSPLCRCGSHPNPTATGRRRLAQYGSPKSCRQSADHVPGVEGQLEGRQGQGASALRGNHH